MTKGLSAGDQLVENDGIVINADADADSVTAPDAAFFELGNLDAPDVVEPEEEFDVSVEVTNSGGEEGTQDIVLWYDLVELGRIEVTLQPGESTTVTFEDVSIPDEGDYALVVTSDDDSVSQPITVTDEAVVGDGVPMGTSCNYTVLAKSGISTVPDSDITGDIGVSPIASTAITGFGLDLDASGQFATSNQVGGQVFAADYNEPTPAVMSTAVSDMEAAYTDAAGRTPDFTNVASGQIGGETLTPGVYRWNSDVTIAGDDLTLQGGPDDVWIFQITGDLTMEENLSVVLSGGAQVENIFWQVAGGAGVEIGANANFAGIVMTQTGINVLTGATVDGKLLAQTDVNLQMATVSGLGT
ncbi:MAG: ice-binding family protein [Halobacteriales archaeon]|nr:ice-binding family protein [Halobacteriales archaeon]